MKRKILLALLMSMSASAYTTSAHSADRPTVPVPIWNYNNPSTQSYNSQLPTSKPLTAPPASITPVETLNGVPLKRVPSGAQSATGTLSTRQIEVKPKQKQIKPDIKHVDEKAANPTAAAQHKTTPVHKMTPLPPTQKKVKNP